MLPLSRKPEIIRLHQLQKQQRNQYISQFCSTVQQWLPNSTWQFLPFLADIYYTYTTICLCRRRLGQEYTYVTMYNAKHYQQQGVLVNSKTRTLMFILEISLRHIIKSLLNKISKKLQQKIEQGGKWKILTEIMSIGVDGMLQQGKMFMLMLFTLGWNKHYSFVDTVLKNQYVYTYMNKNHVKVDYRVEGYLLVVVFVVKFIRFIVKSYQILNKSQKKVESKLTSANQPMKQQSNTEQSQLCRICYDNIKNKSVTSCGHIFCWDCIVRYLSAKPECPVCRTSCQPREIVQLQNY